MDYNILFVFMGYDTLIWSYGFQAAAWGNLLQAVSYDVLVVSLNVMIIMFDSMHLCVCVCAYVSLYQGFYYPR